jgi:hypothetical protein
MDLLRRALKPERRICFIHSREAESVLCRLSKSWLATV